jgi:molecular chaperone DnaJ
MKNYYQILGLSKDASQDDIKKAYRNLSKKYHPDVNPEGEDKFKDIAEAYDVLSDPQKKQMFDMGSDPNSRNPFGGGANFDVDEFLRNMGFGGADPFRNGGGQARRKPTAPDKIITVDLSPLDSYKSVTKEILYQRNIACDICHGSGGEKSTCETCQGSGQMSQRVGNGYFQQIIHSSCPSCAGKGFHIIKACFSCNSTGSKGEMKTIKINIQHGMDDGEFYRLENSGDYHNGSYGNLLIKIQVKPDEFWEKVGDDLIYMNYVDFQGLQKESFEIPHPDGILSIKYPDQFDTSKPLRLKGKGFKRGRVGDMYVKNVVRFKKSEIPTPQVSE